MPSRFYRKIPKMAENGQNSSYTEILLPPGRQTMHFIKILFWFYERGIMGGINCMKSSYLLLFVFPGKFRKWGKINHNGSYTEIFLPPGRQTMHFNKILFWFYEGGIIGCINCIKIIFLCLLVFPGKFWKWQKMARMAVIQRYCYPLEGKQCILSKFFSDSMKEVLWKVLTALKFFIYSFSFFQENSENGGKWP